MFVLRSEMNDKKWCEWLHTDLSMYLSVCMFVCMSVCVCLVCRCGSTQQYRSSTQLVLASVYTSH